MQVPETEADPAPLGRIQGRRSRSSPERQADFAAIASIASGLPPCPVAAGRRGLDLEFLVDGAPQEHPHASAGTTHLVQVPAGWRGGRSFFGRLAIWGPNLLVQQRMVS